ncbi:YkgJ family cysteine cluster protein [Myxococcota bacterium]|nr:YkgJ family cysteine cluster protein [Myxococcota bacterium]MBU1430271.1 YkgJ family cysteine cluster protein [Myxococcota bacterium]MBU1899267.1 YkgJ family cysteine cluster protein [Myxococcota bacterium]
MPGAVWLKDEEIPQIAEGLGLSVHDFTDQYTRLAPNRRGLVLIDAPSGACVFFEEGRGCQIQAFKPKQCSGFPLEWRNADSHLTCAGLIALRPT